MKPHLPKLLLVALLALQAYSPAFGTDSVTSLSSESDSVVLNDLTPEGSAVSGSYTIRGKNITLNGDWTPQYNDTHYVHWVGADGTSAYEMTGSGTVSIWLFQISSESEDAATYTIGKDIIFDQVDLAFDTNDASVLNMNGTLKNSTVEVWKGNVNVSDATLSGNSFFQISKGATLVARNFVVKENVALRNSDGYPVSGSAGYATLEGNLVMNGTLPSITTETQTEYDFGGWAPALLSSGYVQFGMDNDEFAPLNVTGSITINSATAVVFSASDAYITPEAEDSVFICSSVSQPTLNLLKPYANRQMHDEQVEYTKPLDDREFYARAGDDGRVHIYLDVAGQGDGDEAPATTGTVTLNDLVLGEDGYYQVSGKHIQLNGDWMPAYENEYSENYVEWNGEDATQKYTFTGNGTMGDGEEIVCFSILGSGQFSIGEHVKITDAEIYVGVSSGDNPALSVEGTLHNVEFSELHQTIDLQKATLSGYQKYGMEPGGVVKRENLCISGVNSGIELYTTGNTSNSAPKIDGNLILDGQGSSFGTVEMAWNNEQDEVMGPSRNFNAFLYYGDDLTLEVTGSLTIQSETAVVFRGVNEYRVPDKDTSLIICSSVNESELTRLLPYAMWSERMESDSENNYFTMLDHTKPLDDYEFYAKTASDGKVHIYLDAVEPGGEDPIIPDVPGGDDPTLGTVVLNDLEPSWSNEFYSSYEITDKNISFTGDWNPGDVVTFIRWVGDSEDYQTAGKSYTLSGNGTIVAGNASPEDGYGYSAVLSVGETLGSGDTNKFTIDSGVCLRNFSIQAAADLTIKGTLNNVEVEALDHATVDLSEAILQNQTIFHIGDCGTIRMNTMNINGSNILSVWSEGYEATLDGNLVINGSHPGLTQETQYSYDAWYSGFGSGAFVEFEYGEYNEGWFPLTVTGSITILSDTMVLFTSVGGAAVEYKIPTAAESVFICSEVDETTLTRLKAYAACDSFVNDENSYVVKPLGDNEFYAKTASDGKVHIYLDAVEPGGEDPIIPDVPGGDDPALDTVVLNDMVLGEYGGYQVENKNIQLNGDWAPAYIEEFGECAAISWRGTDASAGYTMDGSGKLGDGEHEVELDISGSGQFSIGEDIAISHAEINQFICSDSQLEVKGRLDNCSLIVQSGTLDITQAALSGNTCYDVRCGAMLKAGAVVVQAGSYVQVMSNCESGSNCARHYATLDGNLILNGDVPGYTTEQKLEYTDEGYLNHLRPYGFVQFWMSGEEDELIPLHVTGSITINSSTVILFANEGEYTYDTTTGITTFVSDYRLPTTEETLFVCSGVNEESLSMLKPMVYCEDSWMQCADGEYIVGGYEYFKPLDDYEFYAKTGTDGKVYIYLDAIGQSGEDPIIPDVPGGEDPIIPDVPDDKPIVVAPGDTVILGGEDKPAPSASNPVVMQGGVADASQLDDDLLNNQVIQGTGGAVLTGSDQTMHITGSGSLNYGVTGTSATAPGADLLFAIDGNMNLRGETYNTASAVVDKGVVSVSSATTLGMGSGKTQVTVKEAASLTNFGTVAGDVVLEKDATMLNQNKVESDVLLQSGSTMTNNGAVAGDIVVETASLLSGSGSANNLLLHSGAALNVGNSPGWQKYEGVTIRRGASLTFTVDGTTAATADNTGAGTHSVLESKTLTIGDGTDTVKVTVNVTMGIVSAGAAPFEVELMDIETGNAKSGDFSITLNDNNLLEDGAEVSWDEATQSLVLSASVSKVALATLMDTNAANVANTMWASANAVQEFARTAENQFLVGMPGQTTFWGAALGSFMDISGDAGFSSNMGGYAVGLQHAFTESFRAGFALGQSRGDFQSDDHQLKADQTATMPTLTAQYVTPLSKDSSLSISGHVAYGVVENEADTYQAGTAGTAEWDDKVFNIGVRASWNTRLSDNVTASLFTGLTYQSVEQDSFTEEFNGLQRDYRSGSMSSLSLPLGVTLRGIYSMGGTHVFAPEVTVAYIGDIARDNPEVKTRVMGISREGKGTDIGRSAFMLNAGANWMFDSTWSLGAFYTLEARSHQVNQSVNASLRYSF